MSNTSTAINKIYEERQKFIIFGLTGRTGSGCSTVANILTQDRNFIEKNCKTNFSFDTIEERKNKVVFNYLIEKWQAFYKISVTDILTLFVLKNSIDETCNFISESFKEFIKCNNLKALEINTREQEFKNKLRIDGYEQIKETRETNKNKFPEILLLEAKLESIQENNFDDDKEKIQEIKEKLIEKIQEVYDFYFDDLCKFSQKLKELINQIYPEMGYTIVYQLIGDNVRSSGEAFNSNFNDESIYNLSEYINLFIKLIERKAKSDSDKKKALIVIDAVRNPFEAFYFKDRYSAFYLISVNTEDETRTGRLFKKLNKNQSEINTIDEKEYKNKLTKEKIFISQNIPKCIEISDIHLTNPTHNEENYSFLTQQLFKYLALIIHPGLVTPTPIERCMQIAYSAKFNSGCISRQVGAVITDANYSIKAVGWNDTAAGQVPCLLRSAENLLKYNDVEAFSDYENNDKKFREAMKSKYQKIDNQKLDGRNLSYCFKDVQNFIEEKDNQVHTRSLHAEENAFLQITKYGGEGIEGGILFTTASPCELCSKKAYQLGIKKVIYIDPYPGIANNHILKIGNNSKRPELQLFYGVIGNAYHKLYQPVLSFKDELNWITDIDFKYGDYKALKEENKNLKDELQELKQKLNNQESLS
jgi:deoxycytidylate deaminase